MLFFMSVSQRLQEMLTREDGLPFLNALVQVACVQALSMKTRISVAIFTLI